MALTDINFQEGDGQDFILEIPDTVFVGNLSDIVVEENGIQLLLLELTAVAEGGNIFIMSE